MTAGRPAASLGELAQKAGLVDPTALERLVSELRDRVRAGRPTSLARLLVEKGFDGARVRAAASSVAGAGVRCDACNATYDQNPAVVGREFACSRCGGLIVGLGNLALSGEQPRPLTPLEPPKGAPMFAGGALRFPDAAPAPVPRTPSAPIVPADTEAMNIGETTLGFVGVLPIPRAVPATPPAAVEQDLGGRTMTFEKILPIPPPRPGAAAPQPGGPPVPSTPFMPDAPTFASRGAPGAPAAFAPDSPTFAPPSPTFAPSSHAFDPFAPPSPTFAPHAHAVDPFAAPLGSSLPAPPPAGALDTEGATLYSAPMPGHFPGNPGFVPTSFHGAPPAPDSGSLFPGAAPFTPPAVDPLRGSMAETKSDSGQKVDFTATQDAPPPPGAVTADGPGKKKSLVKRRSYGDPAAASSKGKAPVLVIVLLFGLLLGLGVAGLAGAYFLGAFGGADPKKDEPKKDEPKKDEPKKDEPKKDEPTKDEPK